MIKYITALSLLALGLAACGTKTITTNPPTTPSSPNVGVVVALNALALGCPIAAEDVDPSVAAYLNGPCVTAATGILNIVEANGTVAKVQSLIDTLKTEAASIPSTAKGITIVNQSVVLAQGVLNIYEEVTGQTVTSGVTPPAGASQFMPSSKPKVRKIAWTKAEKAQIAAMQARLKK